MSRGSEARRISPLATAALSLVVAACGLLSAEPGDAAHADYLRPFIESGRNSLRAREDGLPRSTFSFHQARCRADGGLLVIFEQSRLGHRTFAYVMGGPGKSEGSWAGGLQVPRLDGDPEIDHFFSISPEAECNAELLATLQP